MSDIIGPPPYKLLGAVTFTAADGYYPPPKLPLSNWQVSAEPPVVTTTTTTTQPPVTSTTTAWLPGVTTTTTRDPNTTTTTTQPPVSTTTVQPGTTTTTTTQPPVTTTTTQAPVTTTTTTPAPVVPRRFWRLWNTRNGGGAYVVIGDLELRSTVNGVNLAVPGNGTASASTFLAGKEPVNAFDGRTLDSRWVTDGVFYGLGWCEGQWLMWDFGQGNEKAIRAVVIRNAAESFSTYGWNVQDASLQWSNDGVTFVDYIPILNHPSGDNASVEYSLTGSNSVPPIIETTTTTTTTTTTSAPVTTTTTTTTTQPPVMNGVYVTGFKPTSTPALDPTQPYVLSDFADTYEEDWVIRDQVIGDGNTRAMTISMKLHNIVNLEEVTFDLYFTEEASPVNFRNSPTWLSLARPIDSGSNFNNASVNLNTDGIIEVVLPYAGYSFSESAYMVILENSQPVFCVYLAVNTNLWNNATSENKRIFGAVNFTPADNVYDYREKLPGTNWQAGTTISPYPLLGLSNKRELWFDFSDTAKCFKDSSATIPATINDSVFRINNKLNVGIRLNAAGSETTEPMLRANPTRLVFDGVENALTTTSHGANVYGTDLDMYIAVKLDQIKFTGLIGSIYQDQYFYWNPGSTDPACGYLGDALSVYINGVVVPGGSNPSQGAVADKLSIGWNFIQLRNIDMAMWSRFTVSIENSFAFDGSLSEIILFPAQTNVIRNKIHQYQRDKVGLPLLSTETLLAIPALGFDDQSLFARTPTVVNATVSTAVPFNGAPAYYFTGSASYIDYSANADADIELDSDFCIESFVYKASSQGAYSVFFSRQIFDGIALELRYNPSNVLEAILRSSNGDITVTTLSALAPTSVGAYEHVALDRSEGVVRLFKAGVLQASATLNSAYKHESQPICLGTLGEIDARVFPFHGYMAGFRFNNTKSRYNANFTPPTDFPAT